MAPRRWVVNASPLILLGKTGQVELLGALADQVAIPRAVADEVGAKSDGDETLKAIGILRGYALYGTVEVDDAYFGGELNDGTAGRRSEN